MQKLIFYAPLLFTQEPIIHPLMHNARRYIYIHASMYVCIYVYVSDPPKLGTATRFFLAYSCFNLTIDLLREQFNSAVYFEAYSLSFQWCISRLVPRKFLNRKHSVCISLIRERFIKQQPERGRDSADTWKIRTFYLTSMCHIALNKNLRTYFSRWTPPSRCFSPCSSIRAFLVTL